MRGPKEKKERALGEKLNLKAERSFSPKAATLRKPYRPGQHGQSHRRGTVSDYSLQLKEKQKFKLNYDLKEKQLEEVFAKAIRAKGVTRDKVFELLERRLDNALYRAGLAASRAIAHQAILHGHVTVNGKKTTYPSYAVGVNDIISLNENSKDLRLFSKLTDTLKKHVSPVWLLIDAEAKTAKVISLPREVDVPFDVNLVVEYYSK